MEAPDPLAHGRFITLEGGEGVGKSTLLEALAARLDSAGHKVLKTREPGGTPLAERVRELVLFPPDGNEWTPLSEALLMNAARSDHLEKLIRPALNEGHWVICDRFADSTRVYQGLRGGGPAYGRALEAMEREVVAETRPDLTLVLDAAPDDVLSRRTARAGPADAFEAQDEAFHEAVRAGFLAIAKADPDRCAIVDALQTPDAVADAAWDAIAKRLLGNRETA